jgi:hypothetical protein
MSKFLKWFLIIIGILFILGIGALAVFGLIFGRHGMGMMQFGGMPFGYRSFPMMRGYGGFGMMGFGMIFFRLLIPVLVISLLVLLGLAIARGSSSKAAVAAASSTIVDAAPAAAPVVESAQVEAAKPVCPACGQETQPGWKHCPHCGHDL